MDKTEDLLDKKAIEIPPVAFIIFNRPNYTKAVFSEIRKVQPKKLFIIADGPRTLEEKSLCDETRSIVEAIDWQCEVHRNYAEKNLGLGERFRTGLNWFFENVEEGIILEDDQLPNPSFFRFMSEMLEKYRDNDQIMMISGDNFMPEIEISDSYFFSKYFSIWGWATWRRAWKHYDFNISDWQNPKNRKKVYGMYTQKYMATRTLKMFDEVYSRKDTWDTQWLYACLMNNGLCVTPGINLISNIGVDGVHQGGFNQNLPTRDIYKLGALKHPERIEQNTTYDNEFYKRNFTPGPFNLRRWVISILVQYETVKKIYRLFLKFRTFVLSKIS